MQQQPLFYEDVTEALAEVVRRAGGAKIVGSRMKPELPVDQAAQYVRDRLNRERREIFSPAQVMLLLAIGREIDCHAAMEFIAVSNQYSRPVPISVEDERVVLQKQVIEAAKLLQQVSARLEALPNGQAG